jgi:phage gpG-like protein
VSTVPEISEALRRMQARAPAGVKAAAAAMGLAMETAAKLELSRVSHSRGTPTPSPPGSPPALISGALRRSVITRPDAASGYRASVTVGGTIVYARIQELGGRAGRNHASLLPPRPYLRPAAERLTGTGAASRVAAAAFTAAVTT